MLRKGFAGGEIALADRFFDPTDDNGEKLAVLRVPISASGQLPGKGRLEIGRWHNLELTWNMDAKRGTLSVDGSAAEPIELQQQSVNGPCYLRLRSTAAEVDNAGMLIESVKADVAPAGSK